MAKRSRSLGLVILAAFLLYLAGCVTTGSAEKDAGQAAGNPAGYTGGMECLCP
jgi:hypothetical protein